MKEIVKETKSRHIPEVNSRREKNSQQMSWF